ncbi:hypothetical protein L195_g034482 [Trifolium pratense]|uniref:Uncharacterized protein n=2 Tax=Trifolium pratense TaxID=57577 RepID=A0A2K3LIY8_TRIPR|nr:uncharacterized protein LOC123915086 [Trifolium pratense]PNX78504.1 hypothetical protein L195_g034482 [Trifolium pratense]CAJ2640525.1 unnamed protein product [Trifolium pratense]
MAELDIKPALVKNSSTNSSRKSGRRVSFEFPPNNRPQSQSFSHESIEEFDNGHYHPCCLACCAWSCVILFIFIVIFIFLGISYLAFLKAGMPTINVRTFNVTKFQVDYNSQKMDTIISLGLKFSNKNEELKLLYGPLFIDVTSDDVLLGKTTLSGFAQMPRNETNLDMTMTTNDANVNKYAADDLKSDISAYEMVFDVYISGKIGVKIGSLHMINVPFLSSCEQIKKIDVDYGRKPECDIKMFSFR